MWCGTLVSVCISYLKRPIEEYIHYIDMTEVRFGPDNYALFIAPLTAIETSNYSTLRSSTIDSTVDSYGFIYIAYNSWLYASTFMSFI